MSDRLLAHLAGMFATDRYEDLTSEALTFLLNQTPALRRAVDAILSTAGPAVEVAAAQGQATDDDTQARPDIQLLDATGVIVGLIEAKFGAGLTDNQPTTYLTLTDGVVLLIVPARRIEPLWPELLRRAATVGTVTEQTETAVESLRAADVDGAATLAVISWAEVGRRLHTAATAHAPEVVGEVEQFQALCARFEADIFIPFRSEELTSDWGRRLLHFHGIVEDLVARVRVDHPWVNTVGLRWTRGDVWYGSYLNWGQLGGGLWFNARRWVTLGTPLTVALAAGHGPDRTPMPAGMLTPLIGGPHDPQFLHDAWQCPLHLQVGVEYDALIDDLARQVGDILDVIPAQLRTPR